MMPVYKVVTTGSALAAALQTVATAKEGFGFMIGTLTSRTSEALQDTAEVEFIQQQEACVTAYLCCPAGLPTTLVAGEPGVDLLQAVQAQLQFDQILGWFAYRPVTVLQPTNQECMISISITAALDSLQIKQHSPQTFFAIISSLPRHEGSSCEFQQRMFQLNCNSHEFEPVDVQVRNVGEAGPLGQRYQPVMTIPILPKVPAFTVLKFKPDANTISSQPTQSNDLVESMLRNVAYSGLQNQVDAIESIYRKTVRQLETLAHRASVGTP